MLKKAPFPPALDTARADGDPYALCALSDGEPVAFGRLRALEWDLKLRGSPVGALEAVVAHPDCAAPMESLRAVVDGLLVEARRRGIAHLRYRTSPLNHMAVRAVEAAGFALADVGTTLEHRASWRAECRSRRVLVRQAVESDLPLLREWATTLFGLSWFYHDPFFTREQADAVYAHWLESAWADRDTEILVPEISGRPGGFSTCSLLQNGEGDIALFAVAPEAAGQGVGTALLLAVLDWFRPRCERVRVRTQAANYPAIALYQKAGFRIVEADVTLTKTLDG